MNYMYSQIKLKYKNKIDKRGDLTRKTSHNLLFLGLLYYLGEY